MTDSVLYSPKTVEKLYTNNDCEKEEKTLVNIIERDPQKTTMKGQHTKCNQEAGNEHILFCEMCSNLSFYTIIYFSQMDC